MNNKYIQLIYYQYTDKIEAIGVDKKPHRNIIVKK